MGSRKNIGPDLVNDMETDNKILISSFWDLREFCEPDSETLTLGDSSQKHPGLGGVGYPLYGGSGDVEGESYGVVACGLQARHEPGSLGGQFF